MLGIKIEVEVILAIGEEKYVLDGSMKNGHVFIVYEGIPVKSEKI